MTATTVFHCYDSARPTAFVHQDGRPKANLRMKRNGGALTVVAVAGAAALVHQDGHQVEDAGGRAVRGLGAAGGQGVGRRLGQQLAEVKLQREGQLVGGLHLHVKFND